MKKSILCLCLLLMAGTATYSQTCQEVPRRSAAEQAALEQATPCNPAKPATGELNDPRMPHDQVPQTAIVNWKPVFDKEDAERLPGSDQQAQPAAGSVAKKAERTQPEGRSPSGETVNHRNVNGAKSQPESPAAGNPANRREIQGSRTQPEGQTPQR